MDKSRDLNVIEAAKAIKEYCGRHRCVQCIFRAFEESTGVVICSLTEKEEWPVAWELPNLPAEETKEG